MNIIKKYNLIERDVDRIIQMAWEDRTPFDAITDQFRLSEGEVIKLMRQQMTLKNWQKWRARVQGRKTKHRSLQEDGTNRFRCSRQKPISRNKISKKKY